MLVAYPLPDKGYRYPIRRGSGLFIYLLGVWRCLLRNKQEIIPRFFVSQLTVNSGMDATPNKMLKKRLFLLVLPLAFAVTSCSDDDEPTSENLAGTKWEVVSSSDEDFVTGLTVEFKKDGNCVFTPVEWSYAKWSTTDGKLKIILGEDEPDDYIEGPFTINDKTATYTYSWYDCGGKWGGDETYTMTLKRK